jgi:hypothetical protein
VSVESNGHVNDYAELRRSRFGCDLVPVPSSLKFSEADADLNRLGSRLLSPMRLKNSLHARTTAGICPNERKIGHKEAQNAKGTAGSSLAAVLARFVRLCGRSDLRWAKPLDPLAFVAGPSKIKPFQKEDR